MTNMVQIRRILAEDLTVLLKKYHEVHIGGHGKRKIKACIEELEATLTPPPAIGVSVSEQIVHKDEIG